MRGRVTYHTRRQKKGSPDFLVVATFRHPPCSLPFVPPTLPLAPASHPPELVKGGSEEGRPKTTPSYHGASYPLVWVVSCVLMSDLPGVITTQTLWPLMLKLAENILLWGQAIKRITHSSWMVEDSTVPSTLPSSSVGVVPFILLEWAHSSYYTDSLIQQVSKALISHWSPHQKCCDWLCISFHILE